MVACAEGASTYADDVESDSPRQPGNLVSDGANAEDHDRLAVEVGRRGAPQRLPRLPALRLAPCRKTACQHQHPADEGLRDRFRGGAGGRRQRDAAFDEPSENGVVDARVEDMQPAEVDRRLRRREEGTREGGKDVAREERDVGRRALLRRETRVRVGGQQKQFVGQPGVGGGRPELLAVGLREIGRHKNDGHGRACTPLGPRNATTGSMTTLVILRAYPGGSRTMATPLSPETIVYGFTSAGDANVSPDGARIVYTLARTDREKKKGGSQLWMCDIDGEQHAEADLQRRGESHGALVARWHADRVRLRSQVAQRAVRDANRWRRGARSGARGDDDRRSHMVCRFAPHRVRTPARPREPIRRQASRGRGAEGSRDLAHRLQAGQPRLSRRRPAPGIRRRRRERRCSAGDVGGVRSHVSAVVAGREGTRRRADNQQRHALAAGAHSGRWRRGDVRRPGEGHRGHVGVVARRLADRLHGGPGPVVAGRLLRVRRGEARDAPRDDGPAAAARSRLPNHRAAIDARLAR